MWLMSYKLREIPSIQVSGFRVIPKANQAGCWRLFLNLSLPRGQSINDMQHEAKTISQYTTVDKVNFCLLQVGRGAEMLAKFNIKNVYQDN